MNSIVKIRNLSYSYNSKDNTLENISLDIEKGKITTLIGQNGCGKSTLFNIIVSNLKKYQGEVIIDGKKLENYSSKQLAKKVAIVHQKPEIPKELTVKEVVSYGRTPHSNIFFSHQSKQDQEKINFALKVTCLNGLENELVSNLSGGELQRVFIALALAQDTEILFLDEPTSYLDIKYQKEILHLLKRLNKEYGITIVMILHDINQALNCSHNILALDKGKIIKSGKAEMFYEQDFLEKLYDTKVSIIKESNIVITW